MGYPCHVTNLCIQSTLVFLTIFLILKKKFFVLPFALLWSMGIDITPLFDNLERATKIILGLATICKLARNNQELASGGSSEDQPLALITMENLFNLAEITSAFFISEVESLAYGMRQHFSDSKQT